MTLLSRRAFLASSSLVLAGCGHRTPFPLNSAPSLAPPAPMPSGPVTGLASLKEHAADHRLLYGCAVNVPLLSTDPAYAALIREQCSILVAENAMKWASLRPSPTTFNFEQADALIAFAESNRMKIRGHNLVWHRQLPAWFEAESESISADPRKLLLDHIATVAGRYAGRMHSWDVVNEAILIEDGRADGLRTSPWLQLLGPGYIEMAFRAARLADPQALLAYNDYGIEGEDPGSQRKRDAVLVLLRRLKARDVPVDAMGIQSHITAGRPCGPGLTRFLADCRELDLQMFLTEMDVNDRELPAEHTTRDAAVAATYQRYLDLVLRDPAVRVLLTWGITNRYTWLNSEDARADHLPERCLPFSNWQAGGQYLPAPAFFAIRNSIDRRPSPNPAL